MASILTLDEKSANALLKLAKQRWISSLSADGTHLRVNTEVKTIDFLPSLASPTQVRLEAKGLENKVIVAAATLFASLPKWLTRDGATLTVHLDKLPAPTPAIQLHSLRVGATPAEMLTLSFSVR